MKTVKADLHIHTVLSPCGDLEMSPRKIIDKACEMDIKIIGITDHNSTLQVETVGRIGRDKGVFVMGGVEITTREEVHCLAFFPDKHSLSDFQKFIDNNQPFIPNRDGAFGYQVVVDESDQILHIEEKLLITALNSTIEEISQEVYKHNGIFIPAHVDRFVNSIFSQLGFIPEGLGFDALGITCFTTENEVRTRFRIAENVTLIKNSDAHYVHDVGRGFSLFTIEDYSFEEIRKALAKSEGRSVQPV